MGSGSSKDSSSSGGSRSRLRSRVLGASCFSLPSTLDSDENENGRTKASACTDEIGSKSKIPPLNFSERRDEEGSSSRIDLGASSSGASSRALSRFGFIPDRIGLRRLSRTISLRSSRAQSVIADGVSIANSEVGDHAVQSTNDALDNSNELTEENVSFELNSTLDGTRNNASIVDLSSENGETRRYNRRLGNQEPLEGSVRFSRTRSVGRLRDRVLRRTSSSSSGIFGSALLEDRFTTSVAATTTGHNEQLSERRVMGGRRRLPLSSTNEIWPDFARGHPYHHVGRLTDSSYDYGGETLQLAEANNHDLVENRSSFLERRRRIRSQVRALQRLGSRFENLSGHERSCILSGQHRTGRCECRASNRAGNNSSDDTRTRASISRIVMLAEALFEVLDEIHQQSVALSSRPSFSSIGSVPAPKEVVECMPVKVYVKPQKQPNEEAAQCYICLVEYDDGDFMRILPCNHEFHQTCIDKWLKEVHRVCPLCRGDVCRADAFDADTIS